MHTPDISRLLMELHTEIVKLQAQLASLPCSDQSKQAEQAHACQCDRRVCDCKVTHD